MKKRIVILGGGMAALACAWELTRRRGARDHLDVTLYQMGHRLGGKAASSCNPQQGYRVEEHGLHVFWGFYDNAFRMMRECYEELGRPPSAPLATLDQAFMHHDAISVPWHDGERHQLLELRAPRNARIPGDGREPGTDGPELFSLMVGRVIEAVQIAFGLSPVGDAERLIHGLESLRGLVTSSSDDWQKRGVLALLDGMRDLCRRLLDPARRPRWTREIADFFLTTMRGIIMDGLAAPPRNWHALDDESLRDWLRRHGALRETQHAPFLEGVLAAGYAHRLDAPAGTMLHAILRMSLTYSGSILYKFRAGMGETVIAPLYEVLARRGVKFRFFHAVERLELSADRARVATVHLTRQATVREEPYRPLVEVGGLPSWPLHPRYEQLVEGEALRAGAVDLDDWWTDWPGVGTVRLEAGRDFDQLVLGIALGALPDLCAELIADETKPAFRHMVENVRTAATQSAQLWMRPGPAKFAVKADGPPIVIPYALPFDTWADMSHLLPLERWPEGRAPGSLHYLTARFDDEEPVPPRGPNAYPARQKARIRDNLESWLRDSAGGLWPRATSPEDPQALNPYWLHDLEERDGWARLDAQLVSPLPNPSLRYNLALPGTTRYRLRPGGSGYENLTLAGDWTRTSLSCGCVESAMLSGIGAANVIDPSTRRPLGDWLGALDPASASPPRPTNIPELTIPFPPPRVEPPAPHRSLPRYVRREGDLLVPPPVDVHIDVTTFAIRADRAAVQRLMDTALDRGDVAYRVLGPTIIVYAARVDNYPTDHRLGWVPELDFGVWVPAVAGSRREGRVRPERLVTWNPFIWVDDPLALLNGRLYFGFPKDLGWMTIEGDDPTRRRFGLDTLVIPELGASSRVERRPLLQMGPGRADGPRVRRRDRVRESLSLLRESARELSWQDGIRLSSMFLGSMERGMRLVFFKQLPDSADPTRAVYQGIIETDILIEGTAKHQRLPGRYTVDVHQWGSHRLADALGLEGHWDGNVVRCEALWAMRSVFAARVHVGSVIWESRG
ncbi:cytoplasmic membrane protein [Minicystis rosea]|nr:cytoplasmic membrane protein [Minicystis rosea]